MQDLTNKEVEREKVEKEASPSLSSELEKRKKEAVPAEAEKEGDSGVQAAERVSEAIERMKQPEIGMDREDISSVGGVQTVKVQAETVAALTDAESQVARLVEIAELEGPEKAIEVAKHLDDNYILDRTHDELLEEQVHQALVAKGLLEEI